MFIRPGIRPLLLLILVVTVFGPSHLFALPPGYILQQPELLILRKESVSAIAVGKPGIAWGLASGLLLEKKGGGTTFWNPENSPLSSGEFAGIAFRDSEIWCSTRTYARGNGLCHYDGKRWHHLVTGTHGMLSNRISTLHIDADNWVWIGFDRLGVSQYIGDINSFRYFKEISVKKGILVGKVLSILVLETHLWTGMTTGISRVRLEVPSKVGKNVDNWTSSNGFPGRSSQAIKPWGRQGVVVGTDVGLAFWDGESWAGLGRKQGLKVGRVNDLAVSDSKIWVGGKHGLQVWTPSGFGPLMNSLDGLPDDKITVLAIENPDSIHERVYIGTERGAAILIKQENTGKK